MQFILIKKSKLTAYNCSFTDNTAYTGGAIASSYSDYNISDSHFAHNTTTDGGAAKLLDGFLIVTNSHLSNNTAHGDGGIIFVTTGNVIMSNCLVLNNNC